MSTTEHCPSSNKDKKPRPGRAGAGGRALATTGGAGGATAWRSLGEYYGSDEFRGFLEREFPAGASELERAQSEDSRRDFLKVMGASIALAGAATIPGCRQPDHKILTYSKEVPEEIIPGKPLYYATSMPLPGGGAEGLLVETHEGRPTKVEGNPLHPINQGKSSVWAQASILSLYDPDRLKFPVYHNPQQGRLEATWDDFKVWAGTHFAPYDASQGAGLALIAPKHTGPTWEYVKGEVLKRWPKAAWVSYDAVETRGRAEGSLAAFGAPSRELLSLDKAKVIVSLDRDFLQGATAGEPGALVNARNFAATRRVDTTRDGMSRLYVVESAFSITGAQADHRLALSPSRIAAFAVMLAQRILTAKARPGSQPLADAVNALAAPGGGDISADFVEKVAEDLMDSAHRAGAVVLAGPTQPPAVHALCHAMNAALDSVGPVIRYLPMGPDEGADSTAQVRALASKLNAGEITTLVCLCVNPVYDAPDLFGPDRFAGAFAKVPTTVTLAVGQSETADASTWSLPAATYLESWGDTEAMDGTVAPVQPMIAPLYDPSLSEIEFLTLLSSPSRATAPVDGYEIVRTAWKGLIKADFDKGWRRSLQDGVLAGTTKTGETTGVDYAGVAALVATFADELSKATVPTKERLEAVFHVGHLGDGQLANCPWLQELPDPGTRNVWDNPALLSPKTAEALGLMPEPATEKFPEGRMARLTVGGTSIRMPVWILPGMADNTVLLTVGYGRTSAGRVGDGVGFDVYPVKPAGGRWARGVAVAREPDGYPVSSTQNHWSLEGRTAILRAVDLAAWREHGDRQVEIEHEIYKTKQTINFGERLGEMSHNPPGISAYDNPFNQSAAGAAPGSDYSKGPQWGMTIDLSSCTGCGACTIACQAENNIPVVGKKEVQKGREMSWIRVDRYFTGADPFNPDEMLHQPVACQHCENAPCETVCPVNATVHGPEGLNYMTYNRCIGTRYCANNCPYKVRRFNFFEYGKLKFNGDYYGKGIVESVAPERGGVNGSNTHNKVNINLIPPRLRQKLEEIERMQKNPDVTVRMRGVMEKCTYCIQRINAARIETRLHELPGIPDGFFQSACQQACPSGAIVFGDILDPQSAVAGTRGHARSYGLLGYLNTRPRTTYLVKVRNPNPRLRTPVADPFHRGGGGEGAAAGGHAFYEPRKRDEDRGYAMSLRVLGPGSGVHA